MADWAAHGHTGCAALPRDGQQGQQTATEATAQMLLHALLLTLACVHTPLHGTTLSHDPRENYVAGITP